MYRLYVSPESALPLTFIFKLVTWIPHSLMYRVYMTPKIVFIFIFIFTLITFVAHSLMYSLYVRLETAFPLTFILIMNSELLQRGPEFGEGTRNRLDLSRDEETEPILEMTSLLNPLDKLKAADNNSTEPDPTNIVDEDNVLFSKYIDLLEGK